MHRLLTGLFRLKAPRTFSGRAVALALILGVPGPTPLRAEPRHALIMAVWEYADPIFPALPAEAGQSDAEKMRAALSSVGFEVTVVSNPTLRQAKKAVDDFGDVIKQQPGTALFYFTGHGSEYDGKNFLIPQGTTIKSNRDLDSEALPISRILARLEDGKGTANIVFLDCCRNSLSMSGGGMAPMQATGTFIGYATRSGKAAQTTASGSLYTTALAKYLPMPRLSIDDMHTLVTRAVKAQDPAQNPGKYSELDALFYFNTGIQPAAQEAGVDMPKKEAPLAMAGPNGTSIKFAGETYVLKENLSAPGKSTSELREYLRPGETFEDYKKMVGLRLQPVKVDARTLAASTLEQVQRKFPGSYVKEIEMSAQTATIQFIVVQGENVELNLFRYMSGPRGIASAQFVLRNKPPYETQRKFKGEQDKYLDDWLKDLAGLGEQADALLIASAGVKVETAAAAPPKPAMDEKELARTIAADFDKCGKLAQKFMIHLREGKVEEAVGVMSESAFTKVSRTDFIKSIQASNQVFGGMRSFLADRDVRNLGVDNGLMSFTLQADAEYEKASVRETLRFIRKEDGTIEMVGYNRTAKQ